jgi:hypothetical protein
MIVSTPPHKIGVANRRPAPRLAARQEFGRAAHPPPSLPATVAHLWQQAYLDLLLRFILFCALVTVCGCTLPRSGDSTATASLGSALIPPAWPAGMTLTHTVEVPVEWRGGRDVPGTPGYSDIERYVSGYERGWAWCVVECAKRIDFRPQCSDLFISGWAAETYGWPQGVADATERIESLIGIFGKPRVSQYLKQFRSVDPNDETPRE